MGWLLLRPDEQHPVAGEVRCASGDAVVGVWLVGQGNGGSFARTRPGRDGSVYYNGTTDLVQYRVNVGCGGTPSQWRIETRSPEFSAEYLDLVCDDSADAVLQAPYFGRCTPRT